MDVIIERSIVVPRKFLIDSGDEEFIRVECALASCLGLLDLNGAILKRRYVWIPVVPQCIEMFGLGEPIKDEVSQILMARYAYRYSLNPDQLGLIILDVGGIKYLSYIEP
jgi:hypothetical protein